MLTLSVPAFAAGGSTTITAEVKHDRMIVIPVEPQSPQTGDMGVALYAVSALLSAAGATTIAHRRKK